MFGNMIGKGYTFGLDFDFRKDKIIINAIPSFIDSCHPDIFLVRSRSSRSLAFIIPILTENLIICRLLLMQKFIEEILSLGNVQLIGSQKDTALEEIFDRITQDVFNASLAKW